MTAWLAVAGWALAAGLALRCAVLLRRLELVADADHELRGPVSALVLAVEALGRRPELRRRAAALETHLDRLSLGLADLTAARAGRRHGARRSDVRLDGLARAAAEAWSPVAAAAGAEIRVNWAAGPVTVRADRRRLSQALGNVLANAVEHGGGSIELRGERRDGGVRIAVSDEGPPAAGVDERTQPAWGRGAGARQRGRGRGLGIAARALSDTEGSLAAPDLTTVFAAPGDGRGHPVAPGPSSADELTPRRPEAAGRGSTVTIDMPLPGRGSEAR